MTKTLLRTSILLCLLHISELKAGCTNYEDRPLNVKPPAVVLCFQGVCEKTTLDFECANVYGAQLGYSSARAKWSASYSDGKGIVGFSEGRLPRFVVLNDEELDGLFCIPYPGESNHCALGKELKSVDDYFHLLSSQKKLWPVR